jgi:hypothetical protein
MGDAAHAKSGDFMGVVRGTSKAFQRIAAAVVMAAALRFAE